MIGINITLQNAAELSRAFHKAPKLATPLYSRAIEKTVYRVEGDAKRDAPVNKGSGGGNLHQKISSRMKRRLEGEVQSGAKYSGYVDQGTRPHIITIRRKKVLANKRTGQVFGKRVRHPGTKAQPFFTNAVCGNEASFNREMKDALRQLLKSIR